MKEKSPKLAIAFLFDDTLDSSDGVAQYVKTLGAWLSDQAHDVSYLVGETRMTSWHGGKVYSLAKNQRVSFNGNRLSVPLPANKEQIKKVLKSNKFDVLHVQVPYSPFMSQKVINGSSNDTAIVGTFHVFPSGWLARAGSVPLRMLYGPSLQRVNPMLAVSSAAAAYARESFGLKTETSPNVVDLKKYQIAKKPSSKDVQQIVFLGRLVERKGALQLLKAFAILRKSRTEVQLKIAGNGPQRSKLEVFAKQNNLSDAVEFLGFITEDQKPALLANADVACFPSLYGESFGIVLIEAMAAGTGVVLGGNNPGYRSVLGEQPGLLFNPNNPKELAAQLHKYLGDKKLAAKMRAWQQTEVKKYDVAVVGPKLERIYRQAIAKRRT